MSLSRIFKHTTVSVNAEPFILESLGEAFIIEEDIEIETQPEKVGTDIEAIERLAYERGFSAGEKAGFEFGKQKAEALFSGLSNIISELGSFKEALYKGSEKEIVELSLAIAKKVIQNETEQRQELVLDCVRTALKAVVGGGEITVKVNPKDFEILQQHKAELLKHVDGIKGITIEENENLSRGGCLIDTNYGEIDATITSMMEEVEGRLRNA